MRGLLFALFRSEVWQLNWPQRWKAHNVYRTAFSGKFDPYKNVYGHNLVPSGSPDDYRQALKDGHQLWCLNPVLYRWLGHRYEFHGRLTQRVLGLIFRTCVLCRSRGESVVSTDGGTVSVSHLRNIPACTTKTVEVDMSDCERAFHQSVSKWWFKSIYGSDTRNFESSAWLTSRNEMPRAGFNKAADWRLGCLTVSPGVAQITRLKTAISQIFVRGQVVNFNDWSRNNNDLGVSFYYHLTRKDDDVENSPDDRRAMVDFMLRGSPKMRWLLPELWRWKKKGEKFVVFIVHPLAQWLIERVCLLVGVFRFLSVTSGLEAASKEQVFADVNNPAKHYDFLIVSMSVGGTSIELQHDCHRAVVFELPESFPTILNAAGRVHRVGQQHKQEVIILTVAESYDNFNLARAFEKYTKEVYGKNGFAKVATGINLPKGFEKPRAHQQVSTGEVLAGEFIRRKFGMRRIRLGVEFGRTLNLRDYRGEEYEKITRRGKALFELVLNRAEEVDDEH